MEQGSDLEGEAAASAALSESASTGSHKSLLEAIRTAQQVAEGGAGGAAGAGIEQGGDLEREAAAAATVSEYGAAGINKIVSEMISTARPLAEGEAAGAGRETGGGAGTGLAANASAPERRVAGILSLVDAQTAASDGAVRGIAALEAYLRPSACPFGCLGKRFDFDVRRAEAAAAAGAAAGVKAVALMVARNQQGPAADEGLDPELVLAAARMGARAGCLAVRLHVAPAAQNARYTSLLTPLLGGSLPASVAVYNLVVSSANGLVKHTIFVGMALGMFAVSSGLMVGILSSSPRATLYCQCATWLAFAILWLLLIVAICCLFV